MPDFTPLNYMNTTETIGEYSKFIAYLKFINGTDDKENYYSVP